MSRLASVRLALALLALATGALAASPDLTALETELRAAETAFARTMADRDLGGFGTFVAEDAVFLAPGGVALRGRRAILDAWTVYFDGPVAPFSWEPREVVVLASGSLGISSGPVYTPDGDQAGTYVSTWRRRADGRWEIVLDRGCPYCE